MDFRERLHGGPPPLPPPGAFAFDSSGSSQAAGQKLLQAMIMQGAATGENPWAPWREQQHQQPPPPPPPSHTPLPLNAAAIRLKEEEPSVSPYEQERTLPPPFPHHQHHREQQQHHVGPNSQLMLGTGGGERSQRSRVWQIPCSFCRADFATVGALMQHLKKKACLGGHHESLVIAVCPFDNCSYQPGRRTVRGQSQNASWSQCLSILANHIRAKHTLEAEFECGVCGKRLVTPMAHRYHVKQHDNGAKFYCQACGRFFPHAVREQHYAKSHDHVKSFECERCGKCLSSKSSLELHRQVHDSLFRYRCDLCGKQFHQKNNWVLHLGRKHNLLPPASEAPKRKS